MKYFFKPLGGLHIQDKYLFLAYINSDFIYGKIVNKINAVVEIDVGESTHNLYSQTQLVSEQL